MGSLGSSEQSHVLRFPKVNGRLLRDAVVSHVPALICLSCYTCTLGANFWRLKAIAPILTNGATSTIGYYVVLNSSKNFAIKRNSRTPVQIE